MNNNKSINIPNDVELMLSRWISISRIYSNAHKRESLRLNKKHYFIGIPSILLSAIVGTSIFIGIQEEIVMVSSRWILASLSMFAAGLSSLVTFFNFLARSSNHKIASEEYEDVIRELQILRTSITTMIPKDWRNILSVHSKRLDEIGKKIEIPSSFIEEYEDYDRLKQRFEMDKKSFIWTRYGKDDYAYDFFGRIMSLGEIFLSLFKKSKENNILVERCNFSSDLENVFNSIKLDN